MFSALSYAKGSRTFAGNANLAMLIREIASKVYSLFDVLQ
ncbi:hypothetical protein CEV31_0651 [Brucella thiophenivorans]|uniref:Uncharacterized protein n=1 Tax=Brucella thiophenivorans TaxID=571255 RepID=A0A256G300_9HYPH|nr:hypothetical protein CEV31_0651 [Brucella thiophenivorans]